MNITLPVRIALSVLSGVGVAAIYDYGIFGYDEDPGFYGASGLLFAAGVLFPYLKWNKRVWLRALALVLASVLSYYCAVWLALNLPLDPLDDLAAFTIGSVVGAAIVLAAFIIVTPARISRQFISFGLLAGLIGGPVTWFSIGEVLLERVESDFLTFMGFATWHTLICLAIHFGTKSSRY